MDSFLIYIFMRKAKACKSIAPNMGNKKRKVTNSAFLKKKSMDQNISKSKDRHFGNSIDLVF